MSQHPAHALPIDGTRTLAELAVSLPAASRVFHQHGLDFCCNGRRTVAEACRQKQLDGDQVLAELQDLGISAHPWALRLLARLTGSDGDIA